MAITGNVAVHVDMLHVFSREEFVRKKIPSIEQIPRSLIHTLCSYKSMQAQIQMHNRLFNVRHIWCWLEEELIHKFNLKTFELMLVELWNKGSSLIGPEFGPVHWLSLETLILKWCTFISFWGHITHLVKSRQSPNCTLCRWGFPGTFYSIWLHDGVQKPLVFCLFIYFFYTASFHVCPIF